MTVSVVQIGVSKLSESMLKNALELRGASTVGDASSMRARLKAMLDPHVEADEEDDDKDDDSDDDSDDVSNDDSNDARYEPPADVKEYIERRFNAHEGAWLQRALQSVLPPDYDKAPLADGAETTKRVRQIICVVCSADRVSQEDVAQAMMAMACLLERARDLSQVLKVVQAYQEATTRNYAVQQYSAEDLTVRAERNADEVFEDDWDFWYIATHFAIRCVERLKADRDVDIFLDILKNCAARPAFEAFAQSCRVFKPSLSLPTYDRNCIFFNRTGKPPEFGSVCWQVGGKMEAWRPGKIGNTTDYERYRFAGPSILQRDV